jgi:hypothetical protein
MDGQIKKDVFVIFWLMVLKGQFFLSSVDTSNMSKTADKVFEMLDVIVERIGKENIVQVVTRLVDLDEKPAMSFIYKAMDQAKKKIQVNFDYVKKRYISC